MLQQSKRVILNPTWTVPLRIAAVDKVPLIRANPNYLREHNMYVLDANTRQYIDYNYLNTEDLLRGLSEDPSRNKYYIVQGPGNLNALGVLKFPLQDMNGNLNSSDIFMHDTNERLLFENAVRYNSSGCIRLQYPLEFAAELLKGKGWTVDDIKARVPWNDPSAYVGLENTQQSVSLDKPLLVYIMYMTVDQNDDGSVRLFEDHYGLDAKIVEALKASH
jgi:murein L,D-transpeptidase YcbB/YkuD